MPSQEWNIIVKIQNPISTIHYAQNITDWNIRRRQISQWLNIQCRTSECRNDYWCEQKVVIVAIKIKVSDMEKKVDIL